MKKSLEFGSDCNEQSIIDPRSGLPSGDRIIIQNGTATRQCQENRATCLNNQGGRVCWEKPVVLNSKGNEVPFNDTLFCGQSQKPQP